MGSIIYTGIQKGFSELTANGPRHVARWFKFHLYERYREWSLGIDTANFHEWEDVHDDSPDNNVYQPLSYDCLDRVFPLLNIRSDKDIFLDYGFGKGRVVTIAATYPFRVVMGIEINPELASIANGNIQKARRKLKCEKVRLFTDDVTGFIVPPEVTVFFFFNPFVGDVMRSAQEQIRLSLEKNPRRIQIVYMNPDAEDDMFADCVWLAKLREVSPGWWKNMRFLIYTNREMGS